LHAADEAFVMSTTKEILSVAAVGSRAFDPGPITAALSTGFRDLVVAELGTGTGSGVG
jgi:branched-subunit amino acid aminotransferase/4-amino-4-deoxychorismate lyase